ncbi:DNA primase [Alcaligenes sp. SDU_A2]|uniref:DNA primase n=1 Tax=Alcaligenes sp. SDU_A2 TaxID=3136634 RepID=UPI00312032E2
MIPESFVQELLARVDVVDVVGRYVQLRKGGANLLGLCPFHNEKSPSFTVSPTKQFYHCFGCGAHGSAISFLMEHTGASFPEAVRSLAASAGMTVPEAQRSPRQRAADARRKDELTRQHHILETAQAHYLRQLKQSPIAIDYLKRRGLDGETAARFGLGWTGAERRGLATVFTQYEDNQLVESGLVIESEDGRRYDRFRSRIMFPIRNAKGHIIGFGGRLIEKGEPKYLNSPETTLFSKGHELYGLWEGRQGIRQEGFVLIVEGYMDVVALSQHGLHNAVATLGTATTEHHITKLMRASDRLVFSFDGDAAGRKAAWRALNTCLPLVRDDVSIRFMFLPDKHDPDSYVREFGAQAFRDQAQQAYALSRFLLDELASRHRMDEAEGRAACVHEALPMLTELADSTLKVQIQHEFARMVLLTPDELAQRLSTVEPPRRPQADKPPAQDGLVPRAPVPSEPLTAGDVPEFDGGFDGFDGFDGSFADSVPVDDWQEPQDWQAPPSAPSREKREWRTGKGKQRQGPPPVMGSRAVTPMAKRLLRLLIAHPALVASLGDQQLEILAQSPHLRLVQELIALINISAARHAGALQQAVDADSDLAPVLQALATELLGEDELPDPQGEWRDALRRIELDAIKAEQSLLVETGLREPEQRQRYQELTRRIALLNAAYTRQVK